MARDPITHIVILDGTMSSLDEESETNAGLLYKLLREFSPSYWKRVMYEAGIQLDRWLHPMEVLAGIGINRQIKRAYGFIASSYKPGDRIFLFGYSRGAYAVRSLAGVIDQVGLLRPEHATVRNIETVYRFYRDRPGGKGARAYKARYCHNEVTIDMIGVWDTVKALGIRMPLIWRLAPVEAHFHNHELGPSVKAGVHALALHETRVAYEPVLWTSAPGWEGTLKQVWFRGSHGDIGGQLGNFLPARPLSNGTLVWMLEEAETHGLELPKGWRDRYEVDWNAPALGTWRGIAKFFWFREKRIICEDPSESIHHSVPTKSLKGLKIVGKI